MEKVYYFFLSIILHFYFLEAYIATDINTDGLALLALKASVTLNSSHPLTQNWTSQTSICNWIGVTCGSRHHRVTALNVSNMNIQGTIPQQLGNLSFLVSLHMSNNNLHGGLPQDLFRLHRLKYMNLSYNNLNGAIPLDIANLERLQFLSLSENNLQGTIPTKIGNLRNLQILGLWGNKIVGSIPHSISNMSSLYQLDLSINNLTGVIPREISNLHNLEILHLGSNKLSGFIPEALFNISTLNEMDLSDNYLSGSLPSASGYWRTNLQYLALHVNNIGGVIPTSISNSSNLKELHLAGNKFSGPIPNSLGDLRQLEELELFRNNLSSPHLSILTSLTNCISLRDIEIGENPLNGELPDSIGNLSTSLERFYLYSSEIRGKIPLGIGNLTNLIILSLYDNELTGSMPTTLCHLQYLQFLAIYQNKLIGPISGCLCHLPELGTVYLDNNQISGPIPYCIGNVTSLRHIDLSSNRLNNIPMSLWSLKDLLELSLSNNSLVGSLPPDFGNLIAIATIDLSTNKLSGSIPATAGELQKLSYLSLAYNELEGSIPESLRNMISLEALDLSNNILSGVIPKSLEALRYLKYFNVSFNRLEGDIPSKGPFLNFTSQSFMGNLELCGGLLFRPCKTRSFHLSRKSKVLLIILLPLAISLIGLCLVVVFMLKRRGNRNVPTQVESLHEKITPPRISYIEIERATQGFDQCNLLGSGGFGSVYKGRFDNGMVLAIKVFSLQFEGAFMSFDRECEILRNLRHRNLTKVISSCSNIDFKALLLEYMPNGSLEKWLYDDNYFLDIIQRLDIMIDVASALEYLHHGYSTIVVHCDLKPCNVLLDEMLVGHVSDFGLAKLLGEGETIAHTRTLATMGYIAPEYGSAGLVSTSCDVYTYGIMLMETFTRKRPHDEMFQENLSMRSWVCNSLAAAVEDIVDSALLEPKGTYINKKLHCVSSILELALNCTVESPSERLNMKDVLANIKKIKQEFLCK